MIFGAQPDTGTIIMWCAVLTVAHTIATSGMAFIRDWIARIAQRARDKQIKDALNEKDREVLDSLVQAKKQSDEKIDQQTKQLNKSIGTMSGKTIGQVVALKKEINGKFGKLDSRISALEKQRGMEGQL